MRMHTVHVHGTQKSFPRDICTQHDIIITVRIYIIILYSAYLPLNCIIHNSVEADTGQEIFLAL